MFVSTVEVGMIFMLGVLKMDEKQDYLIVYMASCFGSSEVSDRSFVDFDESTICFSEIHAGK